MILFGILNAVLITRFTVFLRHSNMYLLLWMNDLALIKGIWGKYKEKIIAETILTQFLNLCEKETNLSLWYGGNILYRYYTLSGSCA